jgi:SAM-dependent methyltransferase
MRLLDVGCGPGTITTGLARAVGPGNVVGIDPVEAVIEQAREHARNEGLGEIRFDAASAYALPEPDEAFDVAYMHQVLQHVTRPVDLLRETLRVLRPGGLVAAREVDYATMTHWPRYPEIDRWLELYHAVAARNDAEPDAGRRTPAWAREAGFADLEVSAETMLFHDRADIENWGYSWADRTTKSSLAEQALEYGLATSADLEGIADGWRRWAVDPDAFFFYVNIEVIGRRP